jgi:hypothetical protein
MEGIRQPYTHTHHVKKTSMNQSNRRLARNTLLHIRLFDLDRGQRCIGEPQIPGGVALRLTKNRTESQVFEQQSLKLFATIVSTGFTYKISSQYKGFKFPDSMQL